MLSNMQGYDSQEARNRIKSCVSGLEINFTRLASSPHVVCKDDESLALFLALAVTKTKMYGGIFQGSAQEFWREYKIGGRGGWATYTVEVLLLILICQLAAKIRLRLGSFFSTITQFRSAAVVSPSNNYLKLKNPAVSPSIHPHNR